jgi:O-succinylbenzoate synthase
MFKIKQVELYPLMLRLQSPFVTAHGVTYDRPITVVAVTLDDGTVGYGDVQSFADDSYANETHADSLTELQHILPMMLGMDFRDPGDVVTTLAQLTTLSFTKAAVEMAVLDAYGKQNGQSLSQFLGGTAGFVRVGKAFGVANTLEQFRQDVIKSIAEGYQRLKLKITPDTPVEWITDIVAENPGILFSVDANASWTVADIARIEALNDAGVYLLEQPFSADRWEETAVVQAALPNLKLSLDESLNRAADITRALTEQTSRALTLKQAKIGGLSVTRLAVQAAKQNGVLPWIGGMLSSGLGRAADLALASLPGANEFPADISGTDRYFERDIVTTSWVVADGKLAVPSTPGLGVTLDWDAIKQLQISDTITIAD